jgi:hypothetical protein
MNRNLSHQIQTIRLWGRRHLCAIVENLDLWRLLGHVPCTKLPCSEFKRGGAKCKIFEGLRWPVWAQVARTGLRADYRQGAERSYSRLAPTHTHAQRRTPTGEPHRRCNGCSNTRTRSVLNAQDKLVDLRTSIMSINPCCQRQQALQWTFFFGQSFSSSMFSLIC